MYVALIIFAQFLFSLTDLWKKMILNGQKFELSLLTNPQFLAATILPVVPLVIYLYALSKYDLSRSAVTLGVAAVIFSSFLGWYFLHERMTSMNFLGYSLAIVAIILINWK